MADTDITIVLPPVSEDAISDMLRCITQAIVERDSEAHVGGFLGGTYGYGCDWSSETFDMRPYYWGDCDCGFDQLEADWCDTHSHADDCYQSELKRREIKAGAIVSEWGSIRWPDTMPYEQREKMRKAIYAGMCEDYKLPRFGCAVHCTCAYDRDWKAWIAVNGHKSDCTPELPNFRHHASGMTVRWYKYIGRGMEVEGAPTNLTPILQDCLAEIARLTALEDCGGSHG